MSTPRAQRIATIILALLLLAACNMPRSVAPTPSGVEIINTAAAQTVSARLTQVGQPAPTQAGGTPGALPTATSPPPGSTEAATTPEPGSRATEEASACDRVAFVEDVTYPDDSEVAPGTSFVKTWRLRNAGTCTWDTNYELVFTGGDRLGAPDAVPLAGGVAPEQTVDVSVTLQAPAAGGTYRGDFMLRNASNQLFGIGEDNDSFFYQIRVPTAQTASGIVYDFLARAASATWASGTGDTLDTDLTFSGSGEDPNGVAVIKDRVELENGSISGKILLTAPKKSENGVIAGTYPEYTIQSGDVLMGRLGFMTNADGNCDGGNVVFEIAAKEGDFQQTLGDWELTCDGRLNPIEIDLSDLAGETVQFVLLVHANGAFQNDWAIWNSVRIEHP